MLTVTKLCVDDVLYFNNNEFDVVVPYSLSTTVLSVEKDHAISKRCDGVIEWLDDDSLENYSRVPKYPVKNVKKEKGI